MKKSVLIKNSIITSNHTNTTFLSDDLKDCINWNEESGIDTGLENNTLDIKINCNMNINNGLLGEEMKVAFEKGIMKWKRGCLRK